MPNTRRIALLLSFSAWALICSGCGARLPATATVTGKVTLAGKPVTTGRIMFQPTSGRPAVGLIRPDGTYRLTTFQPDDGAVLGQHSVTIEAFEPAAPASQRAASFEEEIRGSGNPKPTTPLHRSTVQWIVPEKYAHSDTSPLVAKVKAGENSFDFDLPRNPRP